MKDRVTIWPPSGGQPIEVYAVDAGRLIKDGWTTLEPLQSVVEAAAETDETETEEGLDYGDN